MTTDRFDQAARFTARFDPEGFLAWLLPGFAEHLRFERWLDTRAAPRPELPNHTADTLAEFSQTRTPGPPWLFLLEFQTEPDPEMFGRLLGQLGKFWREHVPDELPGSRYQLAAAVVNLTGTPESLPASRTFVFPLRGRSLRLEVEERHLATESAGDSLDEVARGEAATSILTFVPLMTGGGEESNHQALDRGRLRRSGRPPQGGPGRPGADVGGAEDVVRQVEEGTEGVGHARIERCQRVDRQGHREG